MKEKSFGLKPGDHVTVKKGITGTEEVSGHVKKADREGVWLHEHPRMFIRRRVTSINGVKGTGIKPYSGKEYVNEWFSEKSSDSDENDSSDSDENESKSPAKKWAASKTGGKSDEGKYSHWKK